MAPYTSPHPQNPANAPKNLAIGLIAGSVCYVVLLCLLRFLCFRRSRTNKKRIAEWSAASFRVSGIAETNPSSTRTPSPLSQHGLTASIVTPENCITRNPSSHSLFDKAVASFQLESPPDSPTLSLHRPLSNAFSGPHRHAMSIRNPTYSRHSKSSSGFTAYAQYPIPPGFGYRLSSAISTFSTSSSQAKPVRQLFEPALPDELALVRYGEYLIVHRSFDDGWCLVARDTSRSSRAFRLSTWMMTQSNSDSVDIGLVPTWVFVKPLKGVTVTRPFRIESINALHLGQNRAHARDTIISGSDFA